MPATGAVFNKRDFFAFGIGNYKPGDTEGAKTFVSFNPTGRRKHESIQTYTFSKPLEFEGIKTGIMKCFPYS